jgi:hypothetical protein
MLFAVALFLGGPCLVSQTAWRERLAAVILAPAPEGSFDSADSPLCVESAALRMTEFFSGGR